MNGNNIKIKLFTRYMLTFVIALATLVILYTFKQIFIMLIIASLIALVFNPVVVIFEKAGIKRSFSILMIFLIVTSLIFIGLYAFVPIVSDQANNLGKSIRGLKIISEVSSFDRTLTRYMPYLKPGDVTHRVELFVNQLLSAWFESIVLFLSNIMVIVEFLIILPFITFFLLNDYKSILKGILSIVPNKYFEASYNIMHKMAFQLGRFVRSWLLDALSVGLLTITGLTILGIENAVIIGIIAGFGHLIPYLGPVFGIFPAVIVSVLQYGNFKMLPAIIIMFAIIYVIDNGFVQPKLYSKNLNIHPLLVIVLILMGNQLMGIFGMLIAVPTATIIKTVTREIYYSYKYFSIVKIYQNKIGVQ